MKNAFDIEIEKSEMALEKLIDLSDPSLIEEIDVVDSWNIDKSCSDLDAWDICFCVAIGYLAMTITTNEDLAIYLEDIHKAASDVSGDYDSLQSFLGKLLYHKGDHIDIVDKNFKNRKGENAYGAFHRLLWGHDVLSNHGDNPFVLMLKQKGLSGVLQAFQHLMADTMSKQGLPLPGSSYLDFEKENGAVSNYLIKIAEQLSDETVGNKRGAQEIYSHMFTLRAEDFMGNVTIEIISNAYMGIRGIKDAIRIAQFKLITYMIAFLGHAIIGAGRLDGVPYVNISEFRALTHNFVLLYVESGKETKQAIIKSKECVDKTLEIISDVEENEKHIRKFETDEEYLKELEEGQSRVNQLIKFLDKEDVN